MKYETPTKAGFYWIELRGNLIRPKGIAIARVEGVSPFFSTFLAWMIINQSGTALERVPANEKEMQLRFDDVLKWGPEIVVPIEFFTSNQHPVPSDIFKSNV